MTPFEAVMFFIGAIFAAIILLLVLIPVTVGAVQFWIYYVKILMGLRKKKNGTPSTT